LLDQAATFHADVPTEVEHLARASGSVMDILGSTLRQNMADEMLLFSLLPGIPAALKGEPDTEHLII
jgi:hypothetical protein